MQATDTDSLTVTSTGHDASKRYGDDLRSLRVGGGNIAVILVYTGGFELPRLSSILSAAAFLIQE